MANQIDILLAEDTPSDIRLTEEALKRSGLSYSLNIAHDGVEAIEYLHKLVADKKTLPDVMLLDLNMPRKNGHQVLEEIKKDDKLKQIPVVILTVSQRDEDIMEALKLKMNYYLAKPVTHQRLSVLVKAIYELKTDTDAGKISAGEDEETHIKFVLAGNPHTEASVLRRLAVDQNHRIRSRVAENPQTPAEVLESLTQDASADVRMCIAENPSAPVELLRKLAADQSDDVRLSLAGCAKLPSDVLESLAEDQNPYVVDAARKALAGSKA